MDDCSKKFDLYCYACGKFTIMPSKVKITSSIVEKYEKYFNLPVHQNVPWAPSIICRTCYGGLTDWLNGKCESMPFGIPMMWTNPGPHSADNCYICVNDIYGRNRVSRRDLIYRQVPSARTPLPHSKTIPIPKRPGSTEQPVMPSTTKPTVEEATTTSALQPSELTAPCKHIPITQQRLNMMVRQLKLSERKTEILAKHLKFLNILAPDVRADLCGNFMHSESSDEN